VQFEIKIMKIYVTVSGNNLNDPFPVEPCFSRSGWESNVCFGKIQVNYSAGL